MKFLRKLIKRTDSIFKAKESRIQFHGEQSGEVENKIKELWKISLIEFNEIEEAYLSLTQFNSKQLPHPTLCIYPKCTNPKNVVEKLSNDFKSIFASKEYVDIIFLTEEMRNECQNKCNYFYKK